ncbi:hypothetical protein [Bradyrhizobium ivorense]|uniref:hypothetical protein n=1 Tax=Bradyrhizobium ivorense TaxID=2511166 RepID=UPI001589F62B|nr:hypothetical protein [Bradyrhizobium ivorense]
MYSADQHVGFTTSQILRSMRASILISMFFLHRASDGTVIAGLRSMNGFASRTAGVDFSKAHRRCFVPATYRRLQAAADEGRQTRYAPPHRRWAERECFSMPSHRRNNSDAKRVIEVAHLKDLREVMQLLWHLFEAVDRLPRGPEHTAAVQTIKRFERRLAVLVQASEKARAARLSVAGRAGPANK